MVVISDISVSYFKVWYWNLVKLKWMSNCPCCMHTQRIHDVLCVLHVMPLSLLWLLPPPPWAMPTPSCPQQPCSAPGASRLWLLSQSLPVSYLAFLFSSCLLFFPARVSFPKNLPCCDAPEAGQLQFCDFFPQRCFSLNLLEDSLVPLMFYIVWSYFVYLTVLCCNTKRASPNTFTWHCDVS